jgi:hypothetical protein
LTAFLKKSILLIGVNEGSKHHNSKSNTKTMKAILQLMIIGLLMTTLSTIQAQEVRKLDDFDAIHISGDVDVTLVAGDVNSATVFAEGISPDDITLYVKGNTLKVQLYDGWIRDKEEAELTITYQDIDELKVSAGARVRHEGILRAESLKLRASSGGTLALEVAVQYLEAYAVEGAVLNIDGRTESQEVNANTGGQYLGGDLDCQRTAVTTNTGGQAKVIALQRLDANANTGGSIYYKGQPEEKNIRSFCSHKSS